MKAKYRVGQEVLVKSSAIKGRSANPDEQYYCEIQCATCDGDYLAKLLPSKEECVLVSDDDIASPAEACEPIDCANVRVVFFGNGNFAKPVLEKLVECGYNICAVVTNPASKQGRNRQLKPTIVAEYATKQGLNVLTPLSLSEPQFLNVLNKMRPTVGVVVEYGILPRAMYLMPEYGTINLHSSLLPEYRGASTISSAIRDGKTYTGLTTFRLSSGVDTGDIINNLFLPIEDEDNSADVLERMQQYGPDLVEDAIRRLIGNCPLVPQERLIEDASQLSYAPKIYKKDLGIDWQQSFEQICNFVRAYAPSPSAWTNMWIGRIGGEVFRNVKIHKVSKFFRSRCILEAGMWKVSDGRLLIGTSDCTVSVEELQLPGSKKITAKEFCNRFHGKACGYCTSDIDPVTK